jgi:hypothetical protein
MRKAVSGANGTTQFRHSPKAGGREPESVSDRLAHRPGEQTSRFSSPTATGLRLARPWPVNSVAAMTPEEIQRSYEDEPANIARTRIQPLAEAGDPVAQFYMGQLCDEARDQVAALAWYRKASQNGLLDAMHYVASFTYHGFGIAQDVESALRLFRKAAEAGQVDSQWRLGSHLVQEASTRDEGLRWLRLALSQGHIAAMEALAKEGDAP